MSPTLDSRSYKAFAMLDSSSEGLTLEGEFCAIYDMIPVNMALIHTKDDLARARKVPGSTHLVHRRHDGGVMAYQKLNVWLRAMFGLKLAS